MTPRHIAFIMDGNGRWATARGLRRAEGYKRGLEALMRVIGRLQERGVEAVSAFAFSTENVARPKDERDAIFEQTVKFNNSYSGNLRVIYIGDIDALEDEVVSSVEEIERRTANNTGTTLCVALNYGAQADIVHAAKLASDKGMFTDEAFEASLSTAGLPKLDMIVRTGGEKRLSNFMLYEAAYAELLFLDKLWPDMNESDADAVLDEFAHRTRKFGK